MQPKIRNKRRLLACLRWGALSLTCSLLQPAEPARALGFLSQFNLDLCDAAQVELHSPSRELFDDSDDKMEPMPNTVPHASVGCVPGPGAC